MSRIGPRHEHGAEKRERDADLPNETGHGFPLCLRRIGCADPPLIETTDPRIGRRFPGRSIPR